jgi:hypothetical protein
MIGAPASKSFTAAGGVPQRIRISPLVWMNAVCLDAPVVAVSWLWLFARSFEVALAPAAIAALFLTAWLIYLADRLGDTTTVDLRRATSFRQRFCLQHRRVWLVLIGIVAVADAAVIATQLRSGVLMLGAVVAVPAIAYLLTNQLRPRVWRALPAKEMTIGVLFAAGTLVPIALHLRSAAFLPWLLFAALCALNCICIAMWERWLDHAQQRISVATAFPRVGGAVLPALIGLTSAAFALGRMSAVAQPIYLCVAGSAALLAVVHLCRRRIQPDVRTALADLVLLTPAVPLLAL